MGPTEIDSGAPAVLAILQARMSSTRLPGKVLTPLVGAPMVLRQIERLRRARHLTEIVIATSTQASDDVLARLCEDNGVALYRGDLHDVLGRFHGALAATNNTGGWTYPKGLDVEICKTSALFAASREAVDPYEREHVTPFIYRRPERFRVHSVRRDPPWPYRWTVDTPEDFAFVEAVYQALYPQKPDFTTADVLAWQAQNPDRVLINTDWRAG
jgi:spore coat polysaccharide biosynthesis protein SpsF